jgi:RNA recognition motif-containing protein
LESRIAAKNTENIFYTERNGEKKETGMQGSKLYVGNLSYSVVKDELELLFSTYGEVREVKVIEGKGFGFVEMSNQAQAEKAREALSGSDYKGRTLRVDVARPPKSRQRRGPRRY